MRTLLQRVSRASVSLDGQPIATIERGLLVLVGVGRLDGEQQARFLAAKIANLRVFEDEHGKTNLSIRDISGQALVVSQFTLYADLERGRRPSFTDAAEPSVAEPLVELIASLLREQGVPTATGAFGAHMSVELVNDGPFTIWLEK